MFEISCLIITYSVVILIMSFLPYPDGYVSGTVRWVLFLFGSWTAFMLYINIKRVATDIHAMTLGRADLENLPDWAYLDEDGNVQVRDKEN